MESPTTNQPVSQLDDRLVCLPRPRVIVGVQGAERPVHALLRGARLAAATGAELRVVRVLAEPRQLSRMLFPQRHGKDLVDTVARDQAIIADGAAWCDEVLAAPIGDRHVIRRGTLIDAIAEEALLWPTRLIVIPAGAIETRSAVRLVSALHVPVLLARPRSPSGVLVAATDLSDASYPVLTAAAELAPALGDRLVFLHNTPPALPALDPMAAVFFPPRPYDEHAMLDDSQALRSATRSVARGAEPRLTSQSQAVDGILEVARACDADLIAIGARAQSSFYRWLTGSTTAAVVRRARRSVLLTPLDRAPELFREAVPC